jgi:HlyD family secretion protein
VVKELATHTPGTVVSPGTVLLTLAPDEEPLIAEVWVKNEDAGFVRPGQTVQIKLASYPFQKFGLLQGQVAQLSPDATEEPGVAAFAPEEQAATPLRYKARIDLAAQALAHGGASLPLTSGMKATAEVVLRQRSVLDYLLSPVQAAWHDALRER